MPHEITPWKKEGLAISLKTAGLSKREPYSREINEIHGEGGGLNASYQTVEAVAKATGLLYQQGLVYDHDFKFKTGGSEQFSLDFANEEAKKTAEMVFRHLLVR